MAKQLLLDRNPCSELVSVARIARDGRTESVIGNLEEIGEHSALVLTESPIAAENRVDIACGSHVLKGAVKSCTRDHALGYFIEIELTRGSDWSPQWFSPQHLLCFSELRLRYSA
jgi:hypothetical protein